MNKFGLLEEPESDTPTDNSLAERIVNFPNVKPRLPVDLAAVDAAAAPHGFTSRERDSPTQVSGISTGRRRRAVPSEPTRHLAIRLTVKAYDRFVAYADRRQLTYHDALAELMNTSGE